MAERPPWRTDVAAALVHPRESSVWLPDDASPALRFDLAGQLWYPDVEPVLGAVRARFDLDAVVLRCLDVREDRGEHRLRLSYLLQPRPDALPRRGHWLPVGNLPASMPSDDPCWDVLLDTLCSLDKPSPPTRRPWSERSWFKEAEAWSFAALRAAGFEPKQPPVQLRNWGLSSVLRFETPAGDIYFKAAAHGGAKPDARTRDRSFLFANEAALIEGLAVRYPYAVPYPIAIDPEQVWMLLPDAGSPLGESEDLDVWEAAIRSHARHQRDYVGQEAELFRLGCLDRRPGQLAAHLDEFMSDNATLDLLDPTDRDRLGAAAPAIRALFGEAASLGIPDTLVHGDLHSWNIGLRDGRTVFFDWTDACVGLPFLDLVTFLADSEDLDVAPGARERLRDAYLDEWRGSASSAALARAAELAEPIGMLHQAISYQHMLPVLEEPSRTSMVRGLTYWMKQLLDWLD